VLIVEREMGSATGDGKGAGAGEQVLGDGRAGPRCGVIAGTEGSLTSACEGPAAGAAGRDRAVTGVLTRWPAPAYVAAAGKRLLRPVRVRSAGRVRPVATGAGRCPTSRPMER
jgi:hypothetical protein